MRAMRTKIRRYHTQLRWFALATIALSVLTACTVSVSGGILGVLGSLGLLGCLALLVGMTQTGCIEDVVTRDDAGVDAGSDAQAVGPCLRVRPDAAFAPCLGAPLPDMAPDGSDMGMSHDAQVGPCLDVPPEPEPPGKAMHLDHDAIFDKIAQGLPADVVARLVPPPTDV